MPRPPLRPLRSGSPRRRAGVRRVSRRSAGALAAAAVGLVMLALPMVTLAVTYRASGGTIGKFKFGGELRGTLKVPKVWLFDSGLHQDGCQISSTPTDLIIFMYNVRLKLNGHLTTITGGPGGAAVELSVYAGADGTRESVAPGPNSGQINFEGYVGRKQYTWGSGAGASTGTLTTGPKGRSGSIKATLVPQGTGSRTRVGAETAPITIKGSWSACSPPL